MSDIPQARFAVIGAGIAGSTFAYYAHLETHPCIVLDKSRGTGGRAGSKRLPHGSVDLGASLISFSDESISDLREHLLQENIIARWQSAYVGVPRMSAITRFLLQDIPLYTDTKIHHLERRQDQWLLRDERYQAVCLADTLIIAAPATQAAMLLATIPNANSLLQHANQAISQTRPQWALWVTTSKTQSSALMTCNHPILETIIKDSDKPGRHTDEFDTWVIQATSQWSQDNIDTPKAEVLAHLIQAFEQEVGIAVLNTGEPHRWLLGRQAMALSSKPYLWDDTRKIGVIGDWLCQGDAEGAMLSAKHAFETISKSYPLDQF